MSKIESSRISPFLKQEHTRFCVLLTGLFVVFSIAFISGCDEKKSPKTEKKTVKKKTVQPKKTQPERIVKKEKEKPVAVVKARKKKTKKPETPQDIAVQKLELMGANIDKDKDERIFRITIDNNPQFQDQHMELLSHFPSLRELNISYTGITDQGLALFPDYELLSQIYLRGNNITDKGMEILGKMYAITRLCVDGTQITDKGVSHLKNMETLYLLHIRSRNKITDGCIESLLHLRGLTELAIGGTKITPEGIKKIRKSLPQCELNLEKYEDGNFRDQ